MTISGHLLQSRTALKNELARAKAEYYKRNAMSWLLGDVYAPAQVFTQELHQKIRFGFRAAPIFNGKRVQRERFNIQPSARFNGSACRLRSGTMPGGTRQVLTLRPAAVAVHDDRNVPRQPRQIQLG